MRALVRKIFALLTPRERRQLALVFVALTVMGALEIVGVGSILPFISVVADPQQASGNDIVRWIDDTLNLDSARDSVVVLGILVLVVLTMRNLVNALVMWFLVRWVGLRNHSLSERLLMKYVHQPYSFYLTRNSSEMGMNILAEVTSFVNGVLYPATQLLAQGTIAVFILALLMVVNVSLALTVAVVLGGCYAAAYLLTQGKLARLGRDRSAANAERYKTASEALGGIKELQLLGHQDHFVSRFSDPSVRVAKHNASAQVIGQVPRYALETLAFGGILIILIYHLAVTGGLGQTLPLIGLYAMAAYRLMPALHQCFTSVSSIRFSIAALDIVYRDLCTDEGDDAAQTDGEQSPQPVTLNDEIRFEGVAFRYPATDEPAVRNLDLSVRAGEATAFVGPTGSGKSTVVDLFLGLLKPTEGRISIDGVELGPSTVRSWQDQMGYVPQHIYLYDDTIERNVAFGVPDNDIDINRVVAATRIAHIHDFIVEELPEGYKTIIGERGIRLSGGQRQRIGLARALYANPVILVLDEATSALDTVTEATVLEAIQSSRTDRTLVIVAHRLATVRQCDTIHVLSNGTDVASGSYETLMRTSPLFRELVGDHS